MKIFSLDLSAASLKMRLVAIGFVKDLSSGAFYSLQHRHNLFELQFVFSGSCSAKIGDSLINQSGGEVYLIPPGIYHSQKSCSSPFEKMCIMFELPAPAAALNGREKEIYFALRSGGCFSCEAGSMQSILADIKRAVLGIDTYKYASEEIRIQTELLLLRLIMRISASDENEEKTSAGKPEREYIIDDFFNRNFHINNGDELLAKQLGVSIRQLNRILKNLYGLNFRDKLKEIRLEVAVDLLASGMSITEISEITGYSCPANFSTFIKNATGNTPTEIKRMLK